MPRKVHGNTNPIDEVDQRKFNRTVAGFLNGMAIESVPLLRSRFSADTRLPVVVHTHNSLNVDSVLFPTGFRKGRAIYYVDGISSLTGPTDTAANWETAESDLRSRLASIEEGGYLFLNFGPGEHFGARLAGEVTYINRVCDIIRDQRDDLFITWAYVRPDTGPTLDGYAIDCYDDISTDLQDITDRLEAVIANAGTKPVWGLTNPKHFLGSSAGNHMNAEEWLSLRETIEATGAALMLWENTGDASELIEFREWLLLQFGSNGERVDAPTAADSDGYKGQWAFDDDYLYICTATDTWKRVGIATWP